MKTEKSQSNIFTKIANYFTKKSPEFQKFEGDLRSLPPEIFWRDGERRLSEDEKKYMSIIVQERKEKEPVEFANSIPQLDAKVYNKIKDQVQLYEKFASDPKKHHWHCFDDCGQRFVPIIQVFFEPSIGKNGMYSFQFNTYSDAVSIDFQSKKDNVLLKNLDIYIRKNAKNCKLYLEDLKSSKKVNSKIQTQSNGLSI